MSNDLLMEVARVLEMANSHRHMADVLRNVNKELAECTNILNETAYTGRFGGKAVKHFISVMQPRVVDLSDKMIEMSGDVHASVRAVQNGDVEGSTRFH